MAKSALYTLLFFLFLVPHLSTALQVTPNSPCASVCQDLRGLDPSDPDSSTTRNSDITCEDADYSSAAGTKFKKCMTCLQTSTFSQDGESDTMWFLCMSRRLSFAPDWPNGEKSTLTLLLLKPKDNLRYTAAYCVFGYPNATNFSPTPCTTRTACGDLEANMRHGIPNPKGTTAYSYCHAGDGNAMDFSHFESCIACTSALGTTDYLANYFAALGVACQQQPAPGTLLSLNDTIFAHTPIGPGNDDDDRGSGLATPAVVGIVAGVLAFLLLSAGMTLVCLRKRRKQYLRAGADAGYNNFSHHRHHSSMSFQCQTHMLSPRFWSAVAEDGVPTPMTENFGAVPAIWTPHHPDDSYIYHHQHHYQDDTTTTTTTTFTPAPNNKSSSSSTISRSSSIRKPAQLQITTTTPPTPPPQAYYSSPSSSPEKVYHYSPSDFRSPLSADTVTRASALLPPYPSHSPVAAPPVPAERHSGGRHGSGSGLGSGFPLRLGRKSPKIGSGGGGGGWGGGKGVVVSGSSGSPVESRTIQTTFAAPPKR
ncbi:hypothetical protein MYCTH_2300674 [Thermothelomyces thermophilus ATCC 42464]|uniref:LPXTG-domain-containing protein n=1 Tax=Thermothelomyces thermophilus (strain ATCC 42464 / BCRC 31852 / DSM 1799) TaxID=573729 RepID=G2Q7W5_THET4|nr:uncharacterized protein MYCTH_2300674 [Thermothelomyces thermophilus ATCC 42464]AEO56122.1 hypothetical protein MYCTH_2300674 [Thermothelomyces thermophilus ATCC 42464]